MRALLLAVVIVGSSFSWAKPITCLGKSKVGVVRNPTVAVEIDPDETPLKYAIISFDGSTAKYLLESYPTGSRVEDYILHTEAGDIAATKGGPPATFHFFRNRHMVQIWDLWDKVQVTRAICPKN